MSTRWRCDASGHFVGSVRATRSSNSTTSTSSTRPSGCRGALASSVSSTSSDQGASNEKTCFQSRFMSTTVHPFVAAAPSPLSSLPTGD